MTTAMVTKLQLQFKKGEGAHNVKVANFAYVNEAASNEDIKAVGDALGKSISDMAESYGMSRQGMHKKYKKAIALVQQKLEYSNY